MFTNRADFKEDKTVYCLTHAQKYASKPNCPDLSVPRNVYIDMDTDPGSGPRRPSKKSRPVDFREIKLFVGSLAVESLGSLVACSGTEQALVPVGLSATKIFWSVLQPEKRTVYRCR